MRFLTAGAHPSVRPRLLLGTGAVREDRSAYERSGGYAEGLRGADLRSAVSAAGLRGRGGAAFPLGRKLAAVASQPGEHVVVVNGEEGEPTSVKDRWLLRSRPHLVIDGALRAAAAVNAASAYFYLSDEPAGRSMRAALDELSDIPVRAEIVMVPPAYIAGEETAAVNAINGGQPLPSEKPPRPFEQGVRGLPTLVSNVETIANLPRIATGSTPGEPETFLLTFGGACRQPGLFEVPFGLMLREAAETLAGLEIAPRGYFMGGYFAGLLNERAGALTLDYDVFRCAGSGLGCGAITVLGKSDCPVGFTAQVLAYFDRENSGRCGSCFNGTAAMSAVASALAHGAATYADVQRLENWAAFLPGRGACGTLDGAANVSRSLLREFPKDVEAHLRQRCANCADMDLTEIGRASCRERV